MKTPLQWAKKSFHNIDRAPLQLKANKELIDHGEPFDIPLLIFIPWESGIGWSQAQLLIPAQFLDCTTYIQLSSIPLKFKHLRK